jgi:hypothetical protein
MSLWMVIVLLGLVKLPVAALMLWIPFRDDQMTSVLSATAEDDGASDSEEDGGSMALGASPLDPHPRSPRPRPRRRGPHGPGTPCPSPPRIRHPAVPARIRTTMTPARGHRAEAQRAQAQRLRLR